MKTSRPFILKVVLVMVLAVTVLLAGMLHIFASDPATEALGDDVLSPDVEFAKDDVTAIPPAQLTFEERIGKYTFVGTENGKSVAMVYSVEIVNEILAKRAAGEQMALSNEEVLYLINDTVELFANYDIVRLVDLRGEVHNFRGKSFYSSQEYYDSFGLVTEDNGASYDLEGDVYKAMLYRLEVLCTSVSRYEPSGKYVGMVLFTDIDVAHNAHVYDSWARTYYFTTREIGIEEEYRISGIETLSRLPGGVFAFWNEKVEYVDDLTNYAETEPIKLYSQDIFADVRGETKYDANADAVVVVELWNQETGELKARLRFDSNNNPEEIAKISELWQGVINNITSIPTEEYMVKTNYRVAVYMTGVPGLITEKNGDSFMYRPDGNLNYWSFCEGNDDFLEYPIQLGGSQAIAEYINQLLVEALSK